MCSAMYAPVIHCGSVRQAAQVMVMEELRSVSEGSRHIVEGCNLISAIAAAAAMQNCTCAGAASGRMQSGSNMSSDGSFGEDQLGCVDSSRSAVGTLARVVFKFQHRPEWLMEGSRLVVRDRTDGCIAGAGVICHLSFVV